MPFKIPLLGVGVAFLATIFTQAGWCEDFYDTDRANREPAVVGPAIIEDQELIAAQEHVEGVPPEEEHPPLELIQ